MKVIIKIIVVLENQACKIRQKIICNKILINIIDS